MDKCPDSGVYKGQSATVQMLNPDWTCDSRGSVLAALSENHMKFLLRRQEGESDGAGEGDTISYHGDTPSWYRKLRVNPHVTQLVVQTLRRLP